MEEELEQNAGIRRGATKARDLAEKIAPAMPASHLPPEPELFEPSNRKKYLDHLVQVQFPALRDLAAKLLESGCFLLDAADLTFAMIERLVVEADEYNEKQAYWDWVRTIGASVMHEKVMAQGDEGEEGRPESLRAGMIVGNRDLRRAFNRLSMERRRALYTVAVLGLTVQEAAERLSLDVQDVARLGREGLREIYGELKDEIHRIRDERTLGHQERGTEHGQ